MVGSTLWAAPAAPDRWFNADAIVRSRAYHRPLARAALTRAVLQAAGLTFLLVIVRWSIDAGDRPGLLPALSIGAAAAVIVWLPSLGIDTWMEYRHQPRFAGLPLPMHRFLGVAAASGLGVMGVGALTAALVHRAAIASDWWPVLAWLTVGLFMAAIGPLTAQIGHQFDPLDPLLEGELASIAEAAGVADISWGQLHSSYESGLNAVSLGGAGARRVLCTGELLRAEPRLRDFVVAHELAHLRRGHHRQAFVASLIGVAGEVLALWVVGRWLIDRSDVGIVSPRNWPIAVAVLGAASVPVGLGEAWLSRSHERRADLDAAAMVGSPGVEAMRALHEHDRSDLDPTFLARISSAHPPPAERLMRAERLPR